MSREARAVELVRRVVGSGHRANSIDLVLAYGQEIRKECMDGVKSAIMSQRTGTICKAMAVQLAEDAIMGKVRCPRCGGTGMVCEERITMNGGYSLIKVPCPEGCGIVGSGS